VRIIDFQQQGHGMSDGVSGGDAGMIAGAAAAGYPAWHLFRWLFTWTDRRAIRRDAKLDAREASLDAREAKFRAEIEEQLAETRHVVEALRSDLERQRWTTSRLVDVVTDLSTELETHAPRSLVLIRARRLLKTIPLPGPAPELEALANKLDSQGEQA